MKIFEPARSPLSPLLGFVAYFFVVLGGCHQTAYPRQEHGERCPKGLDLDADYDPDILAVADSGDLHQDCPPLPDGVGLCGHPIGASAECRRELEKIHLGLTVNASACDRDDPAWGRYLRVKAESAPLAFPARAAKLGEAIQVEATPWARAILQRDLGLTLMFLGLPDTEQGLKLLEESCKTLLSLPYRALPVEVGTHSCEYVSGRPGFSLSRGWEAASASCRTVCFSR